MNVNAWTEVEDPWKNDYYGRLTVKDIEERCDVKPSKVLYWIKKGWLKAEQMKHMDGKPYRIREEDLKTFMISDHYSGHPEDIKNNRIFNRVPDIEECFPVNLIRAVVGSHRAGPEEDDFDIDIWDVNVREFKMLITKLRDREQKIIAMRYRFGMTLDECAAAFGLTRERIRQIEIVALRKLWKQVRLGFCESVPKREYDILKSRYQNSLDLCEKQRLVLETLTGDEPNKPHPIVDFFTINVAELDLTVRSFNCLIRSGINSIGDILAFDQHQNEKTWQQIRNLGRKSLTEIAQKVYEYCGYRLRMWDPENKRYMGTIPIYEEAARPEYSGGDDDE